MPFFLNCATHSIMSTLKNYKYPLNPEEKNIPHISPAQKSVLNKNNYFTSKQRGKKNVFLNTNMPRLKTKNLKRN